MAEGIKCPECGWGVPIECFVFGKWKCVFCCSEEDDDTDPRVFTSANALIEELNK